MKGLKLLVSFVVIGSYTLAIYGLVMGAGWAAVLATCLLVANVVCAVVNGL